MQEVYQFRCTHCDTLIDSHLCVEDGYGDTYCPYCENVVKYECCRPARYVTVAAYTTYPCYGGPEEGGWYYTEGYLLPETVRAFVAGDFPQIAAYKDLLTRRMTEEYGKSDWMIREYAESVAEPRFPKSRPFYC